MPPGGSSSAFPWAAAACACCWSCTAAGGSARATAARRSSSGGGGGGAGRGRTDTSVVPHATELGLQPAWGDVVLKGRLDRLDPDPDGGRGLVVIDYKTGRRSVSQETADAD